MAVDEPPSRTTKRVSLVECALVFFMSPRLYPTEMAKVAVAINHLTSRAWIWGTTEWENQTAAEYRVALLTPVP